ncbi:hypothetical protein LDENG_00227010 [Lucifuga dentata]|nr:hypothetical protein LDENG_00227010 [Lucifuga dentata]
MADAVASDVLVHGALAFPIGTNKDGQAFLAGAYYGQGRVIVVTVGVFLQQQVLVPFLNNAIHWLDDGQQGVAGVEPQLNDTFNLLSKSGLQCQKTKFRKDLSVFVCTAYTDEDEEEIQNFVAEGGSLLITGNAWNWAHTHPGQNGMTDFTGNKILSKMGLGVLNDLLPMGSYKPPLPGQAIKDSYHFRHHLGIFAHHVLLGGSLRKNEEELYNKLSVDCSRFLQMKAYDSAGYMQVMSTLTDIMKRAGMPQASASSPVNSPKDRLLLELGTEVYKVCPDPDAFLPYLIKEKPNMALVRNHMIQIDVNTAEGKEWVNTGLYLSPGMRTYIAVPDEIINKGWKVQIGNQTDILKAMELKRAPTVHEQFLIDKNMMQVSNLWGGLLYLVAPPKTQVSGAVVIVQKALRAPYFKSGVTTPAEWWLLRTAPSPWAELEFENVIFTVPSEFVRNLNNPDLLAAFWDKIMRGIADLSAIPQTFSRKERFVADVQIFTGWLHAGYPIMMHMASAAFLVRVDLAAQKRMWGFFHELGHNQQKECWEFKPHTTEATCNLWAVYVFEEVLGINRVQAKPLLALEKRKRRIAEYVKGGKHLKNWNTWVALDTYLQLQETFGWDAFKKVFAVYHKMDDCPYDNSEKMNLFAETFSQTIGKDLVGFFRAWGWPIETTTESKLSSLPPWTDHPMVSYAGTL